MIHITNKQIIQNIQSSIRGKYDIQTLQNNPTKFQKRANFYVYIEDSFLRVKEQLMNNAALIENQMNLKILKIENKMKYLHYISVSRYLDIEQAHKLICYCDYKSTNFRILLRRNRRFRPITLPQPDSIQVFSILDNSMSEEYSSSSTNNPPVKKESINENQLCLQKKQPNSNHQLNIFQNQQQQEEEQQQQLPVSCFQSLRFKPQNLNLLNSVQVQHLQQQQQQEQQHPWSLQQQIEQTEKVNLQKIENSITSRQKKYEEYFKLALKHIKIRYEQELDDLCTQKEQFQNQCLEELFLLKNIRNNSGNIPQCQEEQQQQQQEQKKNIAPFTVKQEQEEQKTQDSKKKKLDGETDFEPLMTQDYDSLFSPEYTGGKIKNYNNDLPYSDYNM